MNTPRFNRRSAFVAEMNVTPLIDVLLVLIVVYMLRELYALKKIEVALPPPVPEMPSPGDSELVLDLRADGSYALNGQLLGGPELGPRLNEVFSGRPRSVLFIKSAPNRIYQEVIDAIDVAKGAGVAVISLVPGNREAAGR